MARWIVGVLIVALAALFGWRWLGEGEERAAPLEPEGGGETLVGSALPEPAPEPAPEDVEQERVEVLADEAEAGARTLSVLVVSARSFARDAQRVPEVGFELLREGAAPNEAVKGDYHDPWGKPMRTELPAVLELVASGRTDEQGEARIELELPAGGSNELFARVVEPGYQGRIGRRVKRLEDSEDARAFRLIAWPGATARGRVVDAAGAAVDAHVELLQWNDAPGESSLRHAGSARSTGGGRFELDLTENSFRHGHDFVLRADGGGAGTGTLRDVTLSLEQAPQDLELVVGGPGVVRGRVSDHGGAPAAGLDVLVLLASLDEPDGSFVLPEPQASRLRAAGGGRLWATGRTDADGGFEARGLIGAPYVVRARGAGRGTGGYPIRLTREPVDPDGTPLELAFSRPHLAIRLLDELGNPRVGAPPEVKRDRYQAFGAPHDWPEVPLLRVIEVDAGADADIAGGLPMDGRVLSPDEVVFELERAGRYLVSALGGGYVGRPEAVEVELGSGRVELSLRASLAGELASVRVRVLHEGVELSGKGIREPEFDVYLEQLETAAVLVAREKYGDGSPFVLSVPPGRYRLVAEGKPCIDTHHGTLMSPRELDRVERELTLVAGEELEVDLELGVGARLELALAGEPNAEDERAVRERHPDWEENWYAGAAGTARVLLRREGRRALEVEWAQEWTGNLALGTQLSSEFALGTTVETEVLPSGTYQLEATLPGGRTVREEVTLVAGQTTRVRLRFD